MEHTTIGQPAERSFANQFFTDFRPSQSSFPIKGKLQIEWTRSIENENLGQLVWYRPAFSLFTLTQKERPFNFIMNFIELTTGYHIVCRNFGLSFAAFFQYLFFIYIPSPILFWLSPHSCITTSVEFRGFSVPTFMTSSFPQAQTKETKRGQSFFSGSGQTCRIRVNSLLPISTPGRGLVVGYFFSTDSLPPNLVFTLVFSFPLSALSFVDVAITLGLVYPNPTLLN